MAATFWSLLSLVAIYLIIDSIVKAFGTTHYKRKWYKHCYFQILDYLAQNKSRNVSYTEIKDNAPQYEAWLVDMVLENLVKHGMTMSNHESGRTLGDKSLFAYHITHDGIEHANK